MNEQELHRYIKDNYPVENEQVEWKEFKTLKHSVKGHEGNDIISYVSAISNMEGGYLIIGVQDKTAQIIGLTNLHDFTPESIKYRLLELCMNLPSEGLDVISHRTSDTKKLIWVFRIPKHTPRLPVYAHGKLWQRAGDSLITMRPERRDSILQENLVRQDDWSFEIMDEISMEALDESAIILARQLYAEKHPEYKDRLDEWDDITFLNKAQITRNGKITRAALLLLGKIDYAHYLSPAVPIIFWDLKNEKNEDIDYRQLGIPFIKSSEKALSLIRNLKYRYLKDETLFPTEIDQYDPWVIRECLHNCIAHQDYSLGRRINIVEKPDSVLFTNAGSFIPGSIENVIKADAPPDFYRNQFLAMAMVNLKMIDTQGGGIKKMYSIQKNRFFPLPEYDFLNKDTVKVKIYGKILDLNYTNLLISKSEQIDLQMAILLDYVQKKEVNRLTPNQISELRNKGLVEGRRPNLYISSQVASIIGEKVKYIRNKGIEDEHIKMLILEYLKKFKTARKSDIDDLIFDKLPTFLSVKQKYSKTRNLLQALKREGHIKPEGKNWIYIGKE